MDLTFVLWHCWLDGRKEGTSNVIVLMVAIWLELDANSLNYASKFPLLLLPPSLDVYTVKSRVVLHSGTGFLKL